MRKFIHNVFTTYHVFITMGIVCLVVIIIGYGEYRNYQLRKQLTLQKESLASTTSYFKGETTKLKSEIDGIVTQNNLLNKVVENEMVKNEEMANQVEKVNDTAEALDKLSKVDPQLLQKYSKVYFLNENYEPSELANIPTPYGFVKSKKYEFLEAVLPHLEELLKEAEDNELGLLVSSSYRSFSTQAAIKSNDNFIYGAGTANQFTADQGYSEHQLGTTVDFTTTDAHGDSALFDATKASTWLKENAYKYGFILSYPKGNSYYMYEPWHWRYVGIDLAYRLHRQEKNFYDLDQRIINNYLGLFFD